jgi:hypothetical protein
VGGSLRLTDDCIYLIYFCQRGKARPLCSIFKVTIDHRLPLISLTPLNPVSAAAAAALGGRAARARFAVPTGITLGMPGQLRLNASDTLSGVQSIEYQLDGSAWTPYLDDVNFKGAAHQTLSVPVAGDHLISIRATSMAGTQATQLDLPFTVLDVKAPATPTPTPVPTSRPTTPPPAPPPSPTPPPPTVSASVSPASLDIFTCPTTTMIFTATITYTGAGPRSFQYSWISQAQRQVATQPGSTQVSNFLSPGLHTASFTGAGTQAVTATLSLGDSSGNIPAQMFTGGAQLQITTPNVLSNTASFTLICEQQ